MLQKHQILSFALVKGESKARKWLSTHRSIALRPSPIWAKTILATLAGLAGAGLLISIFYKVDEYLTVDGELEPTAGSIDMRSPIQGKIQYVSVKNGDVVNKGDELIRFDRDMLDAEYSANKANMKAEFNSLNSKLKILKSQQNNTSNKISVLEKKIYTKERLINSYRTLAASGGLQRNALLEAEDELYALRAQLLDAKEMINQNLMQQNLQRSEYNKASSNLISKIKQVESLRKNYTLRAPIGGEIFGLYIRNSNYISQGETLLRIVSKSDFKAKLYVPNKDIGFLKLGQRVNIRVDSFPYTRYGELKGLVEVIGADLVGPSQARPYNSFPVTVTIPHSMNLDYKLMAKMRSGMALSANLKLREKRVITIAFDFLSLQKDGIESIR